MRKVRGFTIIEVLVVLIIFSVVVAMAAVVTRGISAGQKRSITVTRMTGVDAAIAQFVAVQKRMPCPADGTISATDPIPAVAASAGTETARDNVTGCTAQTNGVVPWRVLGMSEQDITDGWGRRMTYRVDPGLGIDNRMDMSWCDPASTVAVAATAVCNNACSSTALGSCTPPQGYLLNKGLLVRNIAGTTVMNAAAAPATGAAYVVISHGESGGGGFLNTGVLATSTSTDGDEEKKNYATVAVGGYYNAGVLAAGYYVDDSLSDVAGATHFDDLVSRPSVLSVVAKAGLGPRSH